MHATCPFGEPNDEVERPAVAGGALLLVAEALLAPQGVQVRVHSERPLHRIARRPLPEAHRLAARGHGQEPRRRLARAAQALHVGDEDGAGNGARFARAVYSAAV